MTTFRKGLFLIGCSVWQVTAAEIATVKSVYDGDTFKVNIEGWPPIVGQNMPVRIRGIDTPERRSKCAAEKQLAMQAKAFASQLLYQAETVELKNIKRGKYFRLLADVYVDDKSLADKLLQAGHARRYSGGKRQPWCY